LTSASADSKKIDRSFVPRGEVFKRRPNLSGYVQKTSAHQNPRIQAVEIFLSANVRHSQGCKKFPAVNEYTMIVVGTELQWVVVFSEARVPI